MIDISKSSYLKCFLFAVLYFAEGLEMALIGFIVPMYFLDIGFSLPIITLISGIAAIPWVIKFVWGGMVDYFIKFGRKRFIVNGTVLAIISLISLYFINPEAALIPFAILLFLSHLGILFIDVSADAWAIEISKKKERGKINGSMTAGNLTGLSLGIFFFSFISNNISYKITFVSAGLIIFLLMTFPIIVKEVKKVKKYENIAPIVIGEFKKKTTILIAFFGLVLFINQGLHRYAMPIFEKTIINLDIVQIGLLINFGLIWSVSGAFVGGFLSDRWGRKKVLYIFIVIVMIFSSSLIFVKRWEQLILYLPITFSYAAITPAFLAIAMDVTNPRVGATQFSIFTSISNFGEWFGATITGTLVLMLGFSKVFLYSAWVLGPALILLYLIKMKSPQKTNLRMQ